MTGGHRHNRNYIRERQTCFAISEDVIGEDIKCSTCQRLRQLKVSQKNNNNEMKRTKNCELLEALIRF